MNCNVIFTKRDLWLSHWKPKLGFNSKIRGLKEHSGWLQEESV